MWRPEGKYAACRGDALMVEKGEGGECGGVELGLVLWGAENVSSVA
jgi:hypothetical protein